jgi:hypothetical protein
MVADDGHEEANSDDGYGKRYTQRDIEDLSFHVAGGQGTIDHIKKNEYKFWNKIGINTYVFAYNCARAAGKER